MGKNTERTRSHNLNAGTPKTDVRSNGIGDNGTWTILVFVSSLLSVSSLL